MYAVIFLLFSSFTKVLASLPACAFVCSSDGNQCLIFIQKNDREAKKTHTHTHTVP